MVRVIARLDIKGDNLIKGIKLEGLRVIGDPYEYALKYYMEGVDEIIYIDSVASLYGRNNLFNILKRTSSNIFVPIIAGGGVRNIEDIYNILDAGADKVAINTAAIERPELIREAVDVFGSQCIVSSIQSRKLPSNTWEVLTEGGRERTGIDVIEWAKQVEDLGAGEILLTSVDRDGTKNGCDIDITHNVSDCVSIPVIASGGVGNVKDVKDIIIKGGIDAISIASLIHYNNSSITDIKKSLNNQDIEVRV